MLNMEYSQYHCVYIYFFSNTPLYVQMERDQKLHSYIVIVTLISALELDDI